MRPRKDAEKEGEIFTLLTETEREIGQGKCFVGEYNEHGFDCIKKKFPLR
jgi:hypothetical protein